MVDNEMNIKQLWAVEQEILDVIHEICIEHNLRYTLAYGTLIGAVRHGGFIPWDDDIDIIMPRKDYEKLLSIWDNVASKEFVLQNIRTNPDYTNNFSKIRKNHTTFIQDEVEKEKKYHKGVFVDVFPADRVANGRIANKIQYIACAINLLYTRGYRSELSGLIGLIERILLIFPKRAQTLLRDGAEQCIRYWNHRNEYRWFVPSTIEYARHYYPAELFDNLKNITFENKQYCCVDNPDAFLRIDYGDYMQLPPVEERAWKHHPLIIDFERNYEEIMEERS